jgi:large subunit ribosomal protein L21
MAYAIIRTGGKQYRVEPGDVIRVETLPGEVGAGVEFSEVLLCETEAGLSVGQPLVSEAKVSRRRQGHRQNVTAVRVVSVG